MPKFVYEATSRDGVTVESTLEAASVEAALAQLRRQGLKPKSLREERSSGGFFSRINESLESAVEAAKHARDGHVGSRSYEERLQDPVTCGWCSTSLAERPRSGNCPHCGGTLPLPAGPDRGPGPPPPPRALPLKFLIRSFWLRNTMVWFGLILSAFPTFFLFIMMLAAAQSDDDIPWLLLGSFLSIFFAVGFGMLGFGIRKAMRQKRALQWGQAEAGYIERVSYDTSTRVNGRSPYLVHFWFERAGARHRTSKSTFNEQVTTHYPNEPVWVVAMDNDPSVCSLWPPFA